MLNEDIAYLLGMICGNGVIKRGNTETQIIIDIPHKNLKIEGEDTQQSIRASILDIKERLEDFIGVRISSNTSNINRAYLSFTKNNDDFLIREINSLLSGYTTWRDFRIPKEIFDASKEIKIEFLRGFADVTAHIRSTNNAYGIDYNHRIYFEIMDNWMIVVDIANLLRDINVPVHTIRWAHPNFVDPELKDYNKGRTNLREHQIKIFAEEFEKVGFNIEHKNNLLNKYSRLNEENWKKHIKDIKNPKIKTLDAAHHRYYWDVIKRDKKKPFHPEENNSKIHEKIRGKHFDSWREVAEELGYDGK